ncbi:MAG TPA: hypothetical protein VGR08_13960, partial [Thermomicrobiales bacterium]|nr:hypothetical protein [Thermomicrobiales bacterium]
RTTISETDILTALSGDAGLLGQRAGSDSPVAGGTSSMLHQPVGQGIARYGQARTRKRVA